MRLAGRLFLPRVLYVGNRLWSASRRGAREVAAGSGVAAFRAVVLGVGRCGEAVREFPFHRRAELRAAVELEAAEVSPFASEQVFVLRRRSAAGTTRANVWTIAEGWRAGLAGLRPIFVIPEGALFALSAESGPLLFEVATGAGTLYAFKDSSGAVRTLASEAAGSQTAASFSSFRRAAGPEAADAPVRRIQGETEYGRWMADVLHHVPLRRLGPFLDRARLRLRLRGHARWLAGGAACALVAWAGLAAWELWCLKDFQRQLAAEDARLRRAAAPVLAQRERTEKGVVLARDLGERLRVYPGRLRLLNLLDDLLPAGVTLVSLELSGQTVEIVGQAPQSLAVLARLGEAKGISRAEFVRPVVRDPRTGAEQFHLRFEYRK
ncbi:MAG: PilN domain-containing protein [Deltaproteobacteria bacterium]|nr:PilN domain-containing protein [Deltaproteobacteria bacterium]